MDRMLTDETGQILCGRLSEADDFYTRTTGLMGKAELKEEEGLFLKNTPSIHTCFMKFPIDVIYLDSQLRVIDKETVKPWKLGKLVKGAVHVLELKEQRGALFYIGQQLIILDDEKKGKVEDMDDRKQAADQMNNLDEIRKQYENNALDDQLKSCFIGGFNKRSVKAAMESYREMLRWMQENYDLQLQDITSEKEKSVSECNFLKRQLQDAMEKSLEVDDLQAQYDTLKEEVENKQAEIDRLEGIIETVMEEGENSQEEIPALQEANKSLEEANKSLKDTNRSLEDTNRSLEDMNRSLEDTNRSLKETNRSLKETNRSLEEEKRALKEAKRALEKEKKVLEETKISLEETKRSLQDQYESLKEEYTRLAATKGIVGRDFSLNKDMVKDLTRQLESMTSYCEGLEKQQEALERQLESMQTISREFEVITKESNFCKEELRGYQKKFIAIKRENDGLYGELESAGQLLANILEQFEQKDTESGMLKSELAEQKQQVVKALKEKLELQNTNVLLMEQMLELEKKALTHEQENQWLKKELETLSKEYRQLENSKVIKFSTSAGEEEANAEEDKPGNEFDLARSTSERLADIVAAKEVSTSKDVEKVV